MNLKTLLLLLALTASAFALTSKPAIAQATPLNDTGATYIYVNGATGSNSNSGAWGHPFKTIQAGINRAEALNRSGLATWVMMYPGVYRESVSISGMGTGKPMTIASVTNGTVYIDGTDVLTKWNSDIGGVYNYQWADTVSGCPLPPNWYTGMPPVVLANEMLFVNGSPVTQVMSASQLVPGTFYVNQSAKDIELYPPSGTNMNTAQVEVTARRSTLNVTNSRNLVFRGLTFQHAASCMNVSGANIYSSSNILLNQVHADWNNWGGLGISTSTYVTVENSTASYNGGLGFMGAEIQNGLFTNNEADYNNWRGDMVGLYDFAQGGFKFGHTRNITVNGQRSYNNQGEGLWFDTDNEAATVENSTLVGSITENLKLEANEGPFNITNNTACLGGVGVILMDSAGVTLTNNYFYGNENLLGNLANDQNGQVYLAGFAGGRTYTSFTSGAAVTSDNANITVTGNKFVNTTSSQYLFNTYLSGYEWTAFGNGFHSNGNTWSESASANAFRVPGGKLTTLGGWRSLTGQDGASVQAAQLAESSACKAPYPAYPDFAVLAYDSVVYTPSYTMVSGKLSIPLQVKSFSYGTVKLSISGLPSGVSASFSPSSIVGGNSTLTLSASGSAKSETVPLTIVGTSGSRVHTITLWIAVRPA